MYCHASLRWILGHTNVAKSNLNTVTMISQLTNAYDRMLPDSRVNREKKQMFYNTALSNELNN